MPRDCLLFWVCAVPKIKNKYRHVTEDFENVLYFTDFYGKGKSFCDNYLEEGI